MTMLDEYITNSATLASIRGGPLEPHGDGFARHLSELGYSLGSIPSKLRIIAHLGEWFGQEGLELHALDEKTVDKFSAATVGCWRPRYGYKKSLRQFLSYLRGLKVISIPMVVGPETEIDILMGKFGHYLTEERGLATITICRYCDLSRKFLNDRFPSTQVELARLTGGDVTGYVLREGSRMSPTGLGSVVTALRSFLRFLRVYGEIELDLAGTIPAVMANQRLRGLPGSLPPNEVMLVLETCNKGTSVGLRDYAILLTLSRMGLRGGEIIRLGLDDIDWRHGELRVCGRPGRTDRLPLPVDVGAAIADYLRHGRPQSTSRQLFIRARAPFCGLPRSITVAGIVSRALERAKLHPPKRGTYLLRHTVATEMLGKGASLAEIGEVLRHRHPDTTAIYAKVDLTALRSLALPWPEVISHD